MTSGPQPFDHNERLKNAQAIADQLKGYFQEKLVAIGLYGSLATGRDGPFSDIEMFCVIDEAGLADTLEWTAGAWKAEINLVGINTILHQAGEVRENWAIVQGCYVKVLPLYDPTNIFIHVKQTALRQSELKFRKAIHGLLVGEMYELMGKIRNCKAKADPSQLAYYAASMARWSACLLGLVNHHFYNSGSTILHESLEILDQPGGHSPLCRLVMSGELGDENRVHQACEVYWESMQHWLSAKGIHLETTLEELLNRRANHSGQ